MWFRMRMMLRRFQMWFRMRMMLRRFQIRFRKLKNPRVFRTML
jgi:hypothetical protein